MPVVLVHGVPESDDVWTPMVERLGRDDVVRLSPPGFGAPVPEGFEPHRRAYVDWLVGELEAVDGPIDLVGHDWGAGHTLGVMATRPELVRSWACDVAGIVHPDYEWHDMAQLWRTPEVGEETVAGMMTLPAEEKVTLFESLGMPRDIGARVAAANDETMGRCILGLYRSADPDELGTVFDALPGASIRPGLVIVPTADHYAGPLEYADEVATHAGATTTRLEGLGHWWMLEDPDRAAAVLLGFWAALD